MKKVMPSENIKIVPTEIQVSTEIQVPAETQVPAEIHVHTEIQGSPRAEAKEMVFEWLSTPFGRALVAETAFGLCFIGFPQLEGREGRTKEEKVMTEEKVEKVMSKEKVEKVMAEENVEKVMTEENVEKKEKEHAYGLQELCHRFLGYQIQSGTISSAHRNALLTGMDKSARTSLKVHLIGTAFQLKVWKALLEIPETETVQYSQISEKIGHIKAVRAVGTAIGKNPVSWLVPCHRVVRKDGSLGGYHWGLEIKKAMLVSEQAK